MSQAAGVGKYLNTLSKTSWILINAENHMCGRLSTDIALFLQGKHKPIYAPHISDCGDNVVVLNTSLMRFNDTTWKNKTYFSHSGFPGGLKQRKMNRVFETDPGEPLRRAVYGMLPRNKLRRIWMSRLFLFPSLKHTLQGTMPERIPFLIDAAPQTVSSNTPRLTYVGDAWPEDFGEVLHVVDTFPKGEKSPFDIVDFQKLHEDVLKRKSQRSE